MIAKPITITEVVNSASSAVELRIVDSPSSWRFGIEPSRGKPTKCLELELAGCGTLQLDAGDCLLLAEKLSALGQMLRDMERARR